MAAVEQSWTMDEPYHLLSGYHGLHFGLDTINLEHPPLVKMVAAIPFFFEHETPWNTPVAADEALDAAQELFDDPQLAERIRIRSRLLLLAVFGIPLLVACFYLGRWFAGTDGGLLLAATIGLSPGVLPYLCLAQTDAAAALGFVTCMLGGVRLVHQPRVRWALLAGLGLGVALAAKFSGVLLIPVAVLSVLAIPRRLLPGRGLLRRLTLLALMSAAALAFLYSIYSFADRNGRGARLEDSIELYTANRSTLVLDDRLEPWRDDLLAVAEHSSAIARWCVGFLGIRAQDRIGVYPSFAFGSVDSDGRWWYFPAAFLVRTPLILLGALGLAAWGGIRSVRQTRPMRRLKSVTTRESLLLVAVSVAYLGVALRSSYNIGFRHLLPVLPFLYLPAITWVVRSDLRMIVVSVVLLVEAIVLTPVWMSATNTWWLGPANPTRHALGGSDGDYEQGLRTLGRIARNRGMERLRIVHPTASPGEVRAAAPDAIRVEPGSIVVPGWYAVSIIVEHEVPAILEAEPGKLYSHRAYKRVARRWHDLGSRIRERGEDLGPVAGTFRLYRVHAGKHPDVHLITVETLRADAVDGSADAASTPTLDALRSRGTEFAQAISPMPRTTPALGSLVTGLWPHHHGSREVGDPVTGGTTLAELLHGLGYYTVAVVANPSAGPAQELDRGFDLFVSGDDLLDRWGDKVQTGNTKSGERGLGWAEVVTREALELVAGAPPNRPLFVWVFYFDPHFSYTPPSPWRESVKAPACRRLYGELARHPDRIGELFYDRGGMASRAVDDCRKLYKATISYTDAQIGALREGLRNMNRGGEPLTVFTSDHGESFGEQGLFFEHGETLHDANLRVPLVFAGPGVASGRVDHGSTSLVDVAPSLLEFLGVADEQRPKMDGLDLSAYLRPHGTRRGTQDSRIVFAESASALWNAGFRHVLTGRAGKRVCLNGPRFSLCGEPGKAGGSFSLYDHSRDPDLSRNLAEERPEQFYRMLRYWDNWAPESARYLAARTPRFKLLLSPRLKGGYSATLYNLRTDPAEERDVRARYPRVHHRMLRALEAWAREIPRGRRDSRSPELEQTLESLGYLK